MLFRSGDIPDDVHLIAPSAIEPIQVLKTGYLGSKNPRLHTDEVLIALSMSAATDETAKKALAQLPKLRGCQVHTSVMLSNVDIKTFKKLGRLAFCQGWAAAGASTPPARSSSRPGLAIRCPRRPRPHGRPPDATATRPNRADAYPISISVFIFNSN